MAEVPLSTFQLPKTLKRLFPALLFLGIFFFLPLARILTLGLDSGFIFAPGGTFYPRLVSVLGFTFYQALASTLLTLAFGLPLAFLFARYDFPLKNLLRTLTAIPFMLPTVVVAAGFNALLGPRGWLNILLTESGLPAITFIGTFGAILTAHIFYNTTIVIRLVGDAWAGLDSRLSDSANVLGANPWQILWRVTLPLLRPSILAASLLVFLFDFTSYGVILLLGGVKYATLEVEIYIQAISFLNLPAAALLSVIQLLCTLGLSVLYSRYVSRVTSQIKPNSLPAVRRKPKNALQYGFIFLLFIFYFSFFFLPLSSLPLRSVTRLEANRPGLAQGPAGEENDTLTLDYYRELFTNRRGSLFYVPPAQAAFNSLAYAGLTVMLSLALGFPAASALVRSGRLVRWIDPFIMLPLGASAVTLGLGFIVTFNQNLPTFEFQPSTFTLVPSTFNLLTSPLLIPLAHTTIALPFVIRNLQSALATIPERTREAARVLGAAPWQVWWRVDWPIIRRAAFSAGALAFTVSLGEFGAASLLARPEYPTLPTAIYRFLSQPGALNYGQAMAMATLLMLLTGLGIFFIEKLRPTGSDL
ncbi:MAG: iron ABC transporter permease [Chloroflexi bacterium HGW-Chloroflexi-6]|nr:MAG: iron ABC transporter permease [Chloroflexi bacterium HGW-Chloroflexi-6]